MKNAWAALVIATSFYSFVAMGAAVKKESAPSTVRPMRMAPPAKADRPVSLTPNNGTTTVSSSSDTIASPMKGRSFAESSEGIGRTFSLSVAFPGGGSQPLGNAFGGRMKLDDSNWVGGSLVINSNTDNAKDKSLFGLSGKFQHFVGSEKRARPYGAASLYIWKPGGDANKGADNTAFGASGAVGVEVYFIPEFSAFAETGFFLDTSHIDDAETEFGSFTSAIGVSFNFDI